MMNGMIKCVKHNFSEMYAFHTRSCSGSRFFFFFVRNMADLSVDLLTQHRNKLTVTVLLHLPFFHVLLLSSMF